MATHYEKPPFGRLLFGTFSRHRSQANPSVVDSGGPFHLLKHTAIAPENGCLEDDSFPWDGATWQVRTVSFREGIYRHQWFIFKVN